MPVVYLTAQERLAAHAADAGEALRMIVISRMMRDRLTQAEIARKIGMTPMTFSRRLQNPGSLSLDEFRRLAQALNLTEKEMQRCV